jgi:hypothetical protein
MCPHTEKIGYATLRAAALGAADALEKFESPQRPYECDCGQYHLTTKGLNGGALTDTMVRQLIAAVV